MSALHTAETDYWLEDIVRWAERLTQHVKGMSEETFLADTRTQDAVVRCLECIGQSSRQVLASETEEIPADAVLLQAYWAGNRFMHGYFATDMSRVWATAVRSVPSLVDDVKRLLAGGA